MKKIENLQPTFKSFDKLNLKEFADSLYNIMEKGIQSTIGEEESYTISLNAEFGNGKTTFLKMFEHYIKNKHYIKNPDHHITNEEIDSFETVFINAWESDFYNEPIIAIISEISRRITDDTLKKVLKASAGFILSTANQCVQLGTGVSVQQSMDDAKKAKEDLGDKILKNYEQRKEVIKKLKTAFNQYIKKNNNKILIIVDELDRTRPDYAIHFLEDMKHFFDIENVVFLVAVNKLQMKDTVKVIYGQDKYFDSYYRKFFKHEIDLPNPYKELERFVGNIIYKKFQKDKEKWHLVPAGYIVPLCEAFNLSLRDVEHFMRIFEFTIKNTSSSIKRLHMYECVFFNLLFLKKKNLFKRILSKDYNLADYINFVDSISLPIKEQYLLLHKEFFSIIACSFLEGDHFIGGQKQLEKEIKLIHKTFNIKESDINELIGRYMYASNLIKQRAFIICDAISRGKKTE